MNLPKQHAAVEDRVAQAGRDNARSSGAHELLANKVHNSPRQVAQAQRIAAIFGPAVMQQADADEGEMQSEESLQARFAPGNAGEVPTVQAMQTENRTGLPNQLKAGIESLSGMSLDHVKVHTNSSKPAQLNALAYAQGSDIHLAPGQEQHLPHEAWHVVQQAQGRVQPTMQMAGAAVNDDVGLEREADVMGARAEGGAVQLMGNGKRQDMASQATTIQLTHEDAETAFATFVAGKRAAGFAYGPVGANNCEALALQLVAAFGAAGVAGSATETRIGKGRYVAASPSFIDANWNGGVVTSGGGPVANVVHFENHTAVKYGGLIYDPTCGYVGAEAGWICAFEYITEIDGEAIPEEEDAVDAPSYWEAEGSLALPKPYAKLGADGTFVLMTADEVKADVTPPAEAVEAAAAAVEEP